jgi:hypothetical protein
MNRIALLVVIASSFCVATASAQTSVRVRDSVSRKFQAEKGFFEPAKSSSLKPLFPTQKKTAIHKMFRTSRR